MTDNERDDGSSGTSLEPVMSVPARSAARGSTLPGGVQQPSSLRWGAVRPAVVLTSTGTVWIAVLHQLVALDRSPVVSGAGPGARHGAARPEAAAMTSTTHPAGVGGRAAVVRPRRGSLWWLVVGGALVALLGIGPSVLLVLRPDLGVDGGRVAAVGDPVRPPSGLSR